MNIAPDGAGVRGDAFLVRSHKRCGQAGVVGGGILRVRINIWISRNVASGGMSHNPKTPIPEPK